MIRSAAAERATHLRQRGFTHHNAGLARRTRAVIQTPLLTSDIHEQLQSALRKGHAVVECSIDLGRSITAVDVMAEGWRWNGHRYPWMEKCRDRTIYHWTGTEFTAVARYNNSLIKLVPTQWGAPTFEIDGIKMLVTSKVSPFEDARHKVELVQPRGKVVLDTCGGLGYFAEWCLRGGAARVISFEKNADVIWLRSLNPWSPEGGGSADGRLTLTHGDVAEAVSNVPARSVDAVLHDPPRFGIAGELYSQAFYDELARVLKPRGRLFHYVGTPNRLTSGRDVPGEVRKRLSNAGFSAQLHGDGVLATRR